MESFSGIYISPPSPTQKNLSSRFLLYLIYIFYIQPNRDSWQSRGLYLVLLTIIVDTRITVRVVVSRSLSEVVVVVAIALFY
jgi:hypothetical protein